MLLGLSVRYQFLAIKEQRGVRPVSEAAVCGPTAGEVDEGVENRLPPPSHFKVKTVSRCLDVSYASVCRVDPGLAPRGRTLNRIPSIGRSFGDEAFADYRDGQVRVDAIIAIQIADEARPRTREIVLVGQLKGLVGLDHYQRIA